MNSTLTSQRLVALERYITAQRLTYYLERTDGDLPAAVTLYELNTELSAKFYAPVQGLEVLLRNAMNEQLITKFGADWHDLQTIRLAAPQEIDVRNAIRDLECDLTDNEEITNGDVVAKLSLGFWAALLNTTNDNEIWRKAIYLAFPNRPKGTERKAIHGAVNAFRRLRNRIAHHEKIIHRDLCEDHGRIIDIANWICPETSAWILSNSTFDISMLPVDDEQLLPLEQPTEIQNSTSKEYGPTLNGRPRLGLKSD